MIFGVRQLQEKCIEQNKSLYSVFIDLTKAFDTINREALWTVLECIRCPPKLVLMIRLFHDGMIGQVLSNGNVTDAFMISNGVKQGCILALVLFNVYFTCTLSKIWRGGSTFVTAWMAPSLTCVDSQQRRGAYKLSSKRFSLPTTAHWWHTQNKTRSECWTTSLRHPSFSAWQSVSERRRCSTNLHHTPLPLPQASPLTTHH